MKHLISFSFLKDKSTLILFLISSSSLLSSFIFVFLRIKDITVSKIPFVFLLFVLILFFLTIKLIFFSKNKENLLISLKKILIVFTPTQIILFWGMEKMFCDVYGATFLIFNYIFPIVSIFYLASIFFIILYPELKNKKNIEKNKFKKPVVFFVLFIMLSHLFFGMYHLSEKAAVDEPLWVFGRIQKFWNNVREGEFHKTMVSDKPGITLAIISGAGLSQINPKDFKDAYWEDIENPILRFNTLKKINFSFRFPVLLFNVLMLPFFYFFTKKLFGSFIGLLSVFFIGLSPILLGMSTLVNPDSLLWVFAPLSLLCFLIYFEKGRKYLFLSGLFLGLSILTKYISNIFYVFFLALIFLEYIFNYEKYKNISTKKYFKDKLIDFFILVSFSLFTFFVFLPAIWEQPSKILEATIFSVVFQKILFPLAVFIGLFLLEIFVFNGKLTSKLFDFISKFKKILLKIFFIFFISLILLAIVNTYSDMKFFDFESILASPKSAYSFSGYFPMILANFYPLIFGLSPIIVIGIIFVLFKNILKIDKNSVNLFYLSSFILTYYLASVLNQVSATVRYQIIIYPLAMIISALGIYNLLEMKWLKNKIALYFSLIIIFISLFWSLFNIKPFYLSYASELLPKKFVLNAKDMGDGSYEASQFLNNLPNANELFIWSDKDGVCNFFFGRCKNVRDPKNIDLFDYFVVSSGRKVRTTRLIEQRMDKGEIYHFRLDKLYDSEDYIFKLEIGGRPNNYIKIFPASKLRDN
jgi:4-amino-4-deoxy-L-arabinose transferase-like glycosyltransferase